MPTAQGPSPQQESANELAGRPFAFHPAIGNVTSNRWLYRRATWTSWIVLDMASGDEYAVPQMFLGGISECEAPPEGAPDLVLELTRELEWRDGEVVARRSRVVELPVVELPVLCVDDDDEGHEPGRLAPVISIRAGVDAEAEPVAAKPRWTPKTVAAAVVLGVVALSFVTNVARQSRRETTRLSEAWRQLRGSDDYRAVLQKLGPPARERSIEKQGQAVRLLVYPGLRVTVVLAGPSREGERYVQVQDFTGRVVATAADYAAPGEASQASISRNALPR